MSLPELSISDASIGRGPSGQSKTITVFATLNSPSADPVTARIATVGLTARPGTDFDPVDTVVTFAPGETRKPFPITVHGTDERTPDQMIEVKATEVHGATQVHHPVGIAIIKHGDFAQDPAVTE